MIKISALIAKNFPSHIIDCFGKQSLLFSSAPYYVLLCIMTVGMTIFQVTNNPYVLLFIIYGLIPIVDEIISIDSRNPTTEQSKTMAQQLKFLLPLLLTMIVDWLIFFYALHIYSTMQLNIPNFFKLICFTIVVSNLNAAQFSISHQMMHKPGWRRILGTFHMIKTLNMHFTYEHIFGHHRKVATPQDPASSRKNQNVYSFFIRSYFGAYKSVYKMEKQANKPFYLNYLVLSVLASVLFSWLVFYFYGLRTFIFFSFQVLGAVFYLEVINFIEHYGLSRKKLQNQEYQKVTIKHSWNAPHRLSNYIFFKLQRHSDHHENAMKPYQTLLTLQQSPQLPHGYIIMTVMALFPRVYKQIMNPIVQIYNDPVLKQTKLAQIQNEAKQKTKKFIMELFICVGSLFLISCL